MLGSFKKPFFKRKKPETEVIETTDQETGEIIQEEVEVDGERGLPSVNKSQSVQGRMMNIMTAFVIILFTMFVLWRYYASLMDDRSQREAAKGVDKTQTAGVVVPALDKQNLDNARAFEVAKPPEPPAPTSVQPAPAAPAYQHDANLQTSATNQKKEPTPDELALKRKETAPVMFNIGNRGGNSISLPSNSGGSDFGSDRNDGKLHEALKPTYTAGVKASLIPDRDMFITKGTFLKCTVDPAINSSQPGMLVCHLARDVWSASGRVILLDRGTKLTGEYQGEPKGQDGRIFVLWSRAETPAGVIIDLASPGTDSLGRAGMDGYVNTHFWERFGNAFMVSLLGDVVSMAMGKKEVTGNNNTVQFPNTTQGTTEIVKEMLKAGIAIPNTLEQNQAREINVYVARDLDFRGVYSLEPQSRRR